MPLSRRAYWEVPFAVRTRIEQTTGLVRSAEPTGAGHNNAIAAILHTPGGRFFVKALPANHPTV